MKTYNTEIISVGTELLLGHITNTDARDVSEQLAKIGINVLYHTVVGDNPGRLAKCIEIAKQRADIIITTGGLGPTCDDLTKDNPLYDRYACTLLFYVHQGVIGRLEYPDFRKDPRVQDMDVQIWLGKQIQEDGSTGQCALKLKLFADTLDSLVDMIRYAQDNIVVEDTDGCNMLFKPFDPSCLIKEKNYE